MGNNKYKILVIEDDSTIRSFLETMLVTGDIRFLPPTAAARAFWCSHPISRIW